MYMYHALLFDGEQINDIKLHYLLNNKSVLTKWMPADRSWECQHKQLTLSLNIMWIGKVVQPSLDEKFSHKVCLNSILSSSYVQHCHCSSVTLLWLLFLCMLILHSIYALLFLSVVCSHQYLTALEYPHMPPLLQPVEWCVNIHFYS